MKHHLLSRSVPCWQSRLAPCSKIRQQLGIELAAPLPPVRQECIQAFDQALAVRGVDKMQQLVQDHLLDAFDGHFRQCQANRRRGARVLQLPHFVLI